MKDNMAKIRTEIGTLSASFGKLSRLWEESFESGAMSDRVLTKHYPFQSSFDELAMDVKRWKESADRLMTTPVPVLFIAGFLGNKDGVTTIETIRSAFVASVPLSNVEELRTTFTERFNCDCITPQLDGEPIMWNSKDQFMFIGDIYFDDSNHTSIEELDSVFEVNGTTVEDANGVGDDIITAGVCDSYVIPSMYCATVGKPIMFDVPPSWSLSLTDES